MARDYKHGVGSRKEGYQRQSQKQDEVASTSFAGKKLLFISLLLTAIFIGGFVVVNHFVTQGVQGEKLKQQVDDVSLLSETDLTPDDKKGAIELLKETSRSKVAEKAISVIALQAEETVKEVEFTFYKGLSETEVVVDAEPISVALPVPYYVQAGSFLDQTRAEKEHQRLKKFGHELDLSRIETKRGIYFRLRMGPFDNRLEMNKQRNKLRALGVDTLLVKSK